MIPSSLLVCLICIGILTSFRLLTWRLEWTNCQTSSIDQHRKYPTSIRSCQPKYYSSLPYLHIPVRSDYGVYHPSNTCQQSLHRAVHHFRRRPQQLSFSCAGGCHSRSMCYFVRFQPVQQCLLYPQQAELCSYKSYYH